MHVRVLLRLYSILIWHYIIIVSARYSLMFYNNLYQINALHPHISLALWNITVWILFFIKENNIIFVFLVCDMWESMDISFFFCSIVTVTLNRYVRSFLKQKLRSKQIPYNKMKKKKNNLQPSYGKVILSFWE